MSNFSGNLNRFRYVGERNDRFASRLGITVDRLTALLAGSLPTDTELDSMAARIGVHSFELFSGSVWPSAKVDNSSIQMMFMAPMKLNNAGVLS